MKAVFIAIGIVVLGWVLLMLWIGLAATEANAHEAAGAGPWCHAVNPHNRYNLEYQNRMYLNDSCNLPPPECVIADLNLDRSVDLGDNAIFAIYYTDCFGTSW